MPTSQNFPHGARVVIRSLSVVMYLLLFYQTWQVIYCNDDVIHGALGNAGADAFGIFVASTAAVCAISQMLHLWLWERGALVWLIAGALVYAIAFRDLMLFALVCAMGVRLVQLEIFACKQPARRLRKRIRKGVPAL